MKKHAKQAKVRAAVLVCCGLLPALALARDGAKPMAALLKVKRVHVEKLAGGETATQIRDMLIARLQRTGLFVLTENPATADAFLRGSAEDLIYNDTHDSKGGVSARTAVGVGRSRTSSRRSSGGLYLVSGVGEGQATRIVGRRHEAMAAVRLVAKNGDVIWSTIQESKGVKFHGARVDVAEKVTKQLLADYRRALEKKKKPPRLNARP